MNPYAILVLVALFGGLSFYAWGERQTVKAEAAQLDLVKAENSQLKANVKELTDDRDRSDKLLAAKVAEDQLRAADLRAKERKLAEVKDACSHTAVDPAVDQLLRPAVPRAPGAGDQGHPAGGAPPAVPGS